EDVRLLYVACTRAQHHLAVSLHRAEGKACPAALLTEACRGAPHEVWAPPESPAPAPARMPVVREPLPSWDEWSARREAALRNGRRREAESATDIAHGRATVELPAFVQHGLAKQPRDLELRPWVKGRYGTRGRAGRAWRAADGRPRDWRGRRRPGRRAGAGRRRAGNG